MFIVGKILTYLVLPPGGIVILVAIAGVFTLRKKLRIAAIIAFAAAAILLLLSLRPVADLLISPLEKHAVARNVIDAASEGAGSRDTSPGYIVVLGGGVTLPRFGKAQTLSLASTSRTIAAMLLYRETDLPIVLTGGTPLSRNDESEAETAARLLTALGVSSDSLVTETESRNTWENASLVRPLIQTNSIYLVTSAWHMRRTITCFEANDFTVEPVAADLRTWERPYTFWEFLPDMQALWDSSAALHEYVGHIFYRVRYGRAGYRLR